MFIPLYKVPLEHLRGSTRELAPNFSQAKIQLWGKYLGLMIGPLGEEEAWTEQAATLRGRAVRVKACKLPLNTAVSCYNVYGASTLSHVAQFRAPSVDINNIEQGVLATICSAPKNALPRACLGNLTKLGFRSQVIILDTMSLAARCRVAMTGSSHGAAVRLLDEAIEQSETPWAIPKHQMTGSMIKSIEKAYYTVHNIYHINLEDLHKNKPHTFTQVIKKKLMEDNKYSIEHFLTARVRKWLQLDASSVLDVDALAQLLLRNFKNASRILPQHVCSAFLKTIGNAWITSGRLGGTVDPCIFGCGRPQGDTVSHLVHCPCFRAAARPYMPPHYACWPVAPNDVELLGLDGASTTTIMNRILWVEVAMHCSNTLRRRKWDLGQLVVARVRALCRESPVVRRLMVEHRAGQRPHPHAPSLLDW